MEDVRQAGGYPGSPTFFTLGQRFTQLRNAPGNAWLQAYRYEIVRYTCKDMGNAHAAFFDPDRPDHGRPQYKATYYTRPGFTIPSHVRIEDGSTSPRWAGHGLDRFFGTPTASL